MLVIFEYNFKTLVSLLRYEAYRYQHNIFKNEKPILGIVALIRKSFVC